MQLVIDLLLMVILAVVLLKATGVMVAGVNKLVRDTQWEAFGITAILVAVLTSFPELWVGVSSAWEGNPTLALGNVLGSNIANVSLTIGLAALVGGSVGVVGEFLKRDFFTAFLAGALPLLLFLDGTISRIDGVVLVMVYVIYTVGTFIGEQAYRRKHHVGLFHRLFRRMDKLAPEKDVVWIMVGALVLAAAADQLVRVALRVADGLEVPPFLVGLFLVSMGTTLPELSFEIRAIRKKETGMVYGNLLGSIVANSTLILGITALIAPIRLGVQGAVPYLVATLAFVLLFGAFWLLVRTKKRLDRWEGGILILIYGLFIAWELLR